jgi:hypothetical protein
MEVIVISQRPKKSTFGFVLSGKELAVKSRRLHPPLHLPVVLLARKQLVAVEEEQEEQEEEEEEEEKMDGERT